MEEKRMIHKTICLHSWDIDGKIDDFINILQKLKAEGATNIELNTKNNYGSDSPYMLITCDRLETDEEYFSRIKNNKECKI